MTVPDVHPLFCTCIHVEVFCELPVLNIVLSGLKIFEIMVAQRGQRVYNTCLSIQHVKQA